MEKTIELHIIGELMTKSDALAVVNDKRGCGFVWRDLTGEIEDRVIIVSKETMRLMAEEILKKIRPD